MKCKNCGLPILWNRSREYLFVHENGFPQCDLFAWPNEKVIEQEGIP